MCIKRPVISVIIVSPYICNYAVSLDWGPDYSYYIDAWRARAQAWYDEWKAANPGQKRIHESGSMKGREVTIRTK